MKLKVFEGPYWNNLENELKIPIKIISVGPDRKQTFFR